MKTNIKTNLVGYICKIKAIDLSGNVTNNVLSGEYRIVAVWICDGEPFPSVAIAQCRLGGGDSDIITVGINRIVLDATDVTLKMKN